MYSGAKRTGTVYGSGRSGRSVRSGRVGQVRRVGQVACYAGSFPMISFSRVSKQYGRQILFVDASFQLNPAKRSDSSARTDRARRRSSG